MRRAEMSSPSCNWANETTPKPSIDSVAQSAPDHKLFDGMAARAAMRGACLYRLEDGSLLLTRGFAKSCADLDSVCQLLEQIGGVA